VWLPWVAFGVTVYAGPHDGLERPFYSGKSFHVGVSVPFWVMVAIVVAIFLISSDPPSSCSCCSAATRSPGMCTGAGGRWRGQSNPAQPARSGAETAPPH